MSRLPSRAVAFLTLVVLSACSSGDAREPADALPVLVPGQVVDTNPDGFAAAMESLQGKPVVVNFWASWCGPCVREMPLLVREANRLADEVAFLGVNARDDEDSALAFIERFEVPFPSVGDPDGAVMRDQNVLGLPVTKFYRSDGVLAFVSNGEVDEETLVSKIDELLRID